MSSFDIESIERQLALTMTSWSKALFRGEDASQFFQRFLDRSTLPASVKDAAYQRVHRRGIPLDGLSLGRGRQSRGIIAMTSAGPVVAQQRLPYHEPRRAVLAPFTILSTSQALRLVNAQRPGLTARLLHHRDDELIVTEYVAGTHAASTDGLRVDVAARAALLEQLPRAMVDLATLHVPAEKRLHPRVDSVASVLDRAETVRQMRYPDNGTRLAEFGISHVLLRELRAAAETFTQRPTAILHNDLHHGNVLVRFDLEGRRPRGIVLLDLQCLTEGDPIQDPALAAIKFNCTPDEARTLLNRWKAEIGEARSAGVDRDLPVAMAAFGSAQASVMIPAADHAVRGTAQYHRESLDHVIARETRGLTPLVGAVLNYAGKGEDAARWVRTRLERTIPRNPAFVATSGLQPVRGAQPEGAQTSAAAESDRQIPRHVAEMKRAGEKSVGLRRSREK